MKTVLTLITFLCLSFTAMSQTITLLHRDTVAQNRVSFRVSVNNNLSDLESVRIAFYQQTANDTLLLLESTYLLSENDPSAFYSLKKTETGYEFGLGLYEIETYRCKLYLKRENTSEEEITLN